MNRMKIEKEPLEKLYEVQLHGKCKVVDYIKGGVKIEKITKSRYNKVLASSAKEAAALALKAHKEGVIKWSVESAVFDVTCKAKDARLLVAETTVAHFLKATDPQRLEVVFNKGQTKSPQGMYFGGQMRRNGPMATQGTWRYSYDAKGYLYSYAMRIAFRTTYGGKDFVLLNGDGAPTKATNAFMQTLRGALRQEGEGAVPHAFIPFSVLEQARIDPPDVRVIATTQDRTVHVKIPKPREGGRTHQVHHFLGETLFEANGKVLVCGLDRNDDPNKRMFYMCRIPVPKKKSEWPKSVDEALALLRPPGLPKNTKRQGEWFFVPKRSFKTHDLTLRGRRIPIISDQKKEQSSILTNVGTLIVGMVGTRVNRHVTSSLAIDDGVYVKGVITDAEHSKLTLGQVWHKVVKNRAIVGWRYVPTGQARGTRVD